MTQHDASGNLSFQSIFPLHLIMETDLTSGTLFKKGEKGMMIPTIVAVCDVFIS
jgi:hypothetical protein